MGLSLINLPDPAEQIRKLQGEIYARNREVESLKGQLAAEREEVQSSRELLGVQAQAVQNLRTVLGPLFNGLKGIFGEMERAGFETFDPEPQHPNSRSSAVWDSWKKKMGPNSAAAKIIDLLMVHRELTHDQIRIQIGTNRMQTVYDAVSKLNKASLLNKNGDKFSLKDL